MYLKLKNKLNLWYLLKDYVNYNKYVYIKESDLIIKKSLGDGHFIC